MNNKTPLFPWLIVLYEVAIYLSMDAYVPAFPQISHDLLVGPHMVQYTATVWMLGGLSVMLLLGPLSDRYGRRPILLWGGLLYILSTIGCALAPNIHALLVTRFFQGMAMPSMFIGGYSVINEYFESQQAIKILALMNSVRILAPAFGPLLGGALLLVISWRWIFVILAVWSVVALVLLYLKMPETVDTDHSKPIKLVEVSRQYKSVISNFQFIVYALVTMLPVIGLIAWMLAGPFIVVHRFHHTVMVYCIMQAIIFGGFILGNYIVNKFTNEQRNQLFIDLGLGLSILAAIACALFSWLMPSSLFVFVFTVTLLLLGCGLYMPIMSRFTLEQSDQSMGVRVTIFSVVRMGCGAMGTVCLAWFYNGSLLSISSIILLFTLIAAVLGALYCRGAASV